MARKRQPRIPTMEPESIPDLDAAAETYDEAKNQRVKKTLKEREAKDSLLEKMIEYNLERHVTPDGLVVTVTGKKNVRTERVEEAAEGEQEESGNGDA